MKLVTSNPGKRTDWRHLWPDIEMVAIDLPEIQGSHEEIAKAKAKAAYEQLKTPVIVDDCSLRIHRFGGLPGPYVKWFLANNSYQQIMNLAGGNNAVAECMLVFYDGKEFVTSIGRCEGSIAAEADPNQPGFGFEVVFEQTGLGCTLAKMTPNDKYAISHRAKAIRKLIALLKMRSGQ